MTAFSMGEGKERPGVNCPASCIYIRCLLMSLDMIWFGIGDGGAVAAGAGEWSGGGEIGEEQLYVGAVEPSSRLVYSEEGFCCTRGGKCVVGVRLVVVEVSGGVAQEIA